jgi:hypothetical protein
MDEEFYISPETLVGDNIYSTNQRSSKKTILYIFAIINTKTLKKDVSTIKKILSDDCYITHSSLNNQLSLYKKDFIIIKSIIDNQSNYKYLSDTTEDIIIDFFNCMENSEKIRIEMNQQYVVN